MKGLPKTKVKSGTIIFLLWAIAVFLVINILAKLSIIDLSGLLVNSITVITAVALLIEVGVMDIIKRRKGKGWSIFVMLVAGAALLGVVLELLGVTMSSTMMSILAVVDAALLISAIAEIFR